MKNLTKTIITVAVSALLLTMAPWQNARAATGSTDVTINFPNIVILYYPDTLLLTFTASDITDNSATPIDSAALGATAGFDANITSAGTPVTDVAVTISNAYAIRGISSSGAFTVSGSFTSDTASNGGSDAVGSNLAVSDAAPSASFATPEVGDITFDLDIQDVTTSGNHTGMTYSITVTAP
jgi:hypothetical protein